VLFAILTLFPEALAAYADVGVLRMARDRQRARILLVDFRDFTRDRHRTVDDRPFGGGPGMVLKAEPLADCIEWLEERHGAFRKLALCPSGETFRQAHAETLAHEPRVLLLCGRYEGFDQRLIEHFGFEELSVGDFVLAGGELAALMVVEATLRLVPGVLGDERSAVEDSFHDGGGLDHPHYTRPRVFRGREVPDVLLSGDHDRIARWRAEQASRRTKARRPALWRPPAHIPQPKHGPTAWSTRDTGAPHARAGEPVTDEAEPHGSE
jgi:tRNA (guanine37-N1)-methyltransferase